MVYSHTDDHPSKALSTLETIVGEIVADADFGDSRRFW